MSAIGRAFVPTQISLHRRKYREHVVANTIFFYGAVGFGLALLGAAWVSPRCITGIATLLVQGMCKAFMMAMQPSLSTSMEWQVVQQPTGTYTPQEHSLRVAPLFAEPILAYLLYYVVLGAMHLWDNRDKRRVEVLNKKLRKMVAELKVVYARSSSRDHVCYSCSHLPSSACPCIPCTAPHFLGEGLACRRQIAVSVGLYADVNNRLCCRTPRGMRRQQSCWKAMTQIMYRPPLKSSSNSRLCGQHTFREQGRPWPSRLRCASLPVPLLQ